MYKVLIVEDENIIRKGITFQMDWMNYDCVVIGGASDGEEGLEKIRDLKPDIVITDIRMPFKDGLRMIEEALDYHRFETIILTGYSEFDYAKKAISLGVTEYILKPIDYALLRKALQKLIARKNASENDLLGIYKSVLDVDLITTGSNLTQQAMDYIKSNYSEKISLDSVSKICEISSVHLNAKLKEDTNYTFNDLLNRYRIMKAIEIIRTHNVLIYEIAEMVGFSDYKYFSHVFKKYVGYSPSSLLN